MSSKQLPYPRFYKAHGIRFLVHLKTPILSNYRELVLPRESILHWVDYEGKYPVGPTQDEPILVKSSDRIYVEAVSKYPDNNKDGWVVAKNNTGGLVIKYDSENPNIKRMMKMVNDYVSKDVLPMYSYGLLSTSYRYRKYIDSELNRWYNYHYTVFQTALKTSKISDRHQFIELDVPKSFPSFQNIKKGLSGIDKTNIRYLPARDHWLIMAFWNLIAGNGNDFIFTNYELKDFNKINIIWKADDKYTIMNLGKFMGFAHGETATIKPAKLQRRLIRMFIGINSASDGETVVDDELSAEVDNFSGDENEPDIEDVDMFDDSDMEEELDDDADIQLLNPFNKKVVLNTDAMKSEVASRNFIDPSKIVLDDDDGASDDDDDEDAEFMQALDVVADDYDVESTGYKAYIPKSSAPDSVIEEDGAKLVKAGVMAVGTFDRFKRMAREAGNIIDPLNTNLTINESSRITKEDITINEVNPLPVVSNDLLDESMSNSSLSKFNEQYIENVYHKDVLNAVMSIQRGGLVIKDYQIDKVETVNDKYNVHKVQIETLKGHTSTLSFKVPVVETDGTFKSGGSRRYMRKQRGDKNTDTFYVIS